MIRAVRGSVAVVLVALVSSGCVAPAAPLTSETRTHVPAWTTVLSNETVSLGGPAGTYQAVHFPLREVHPAQTGAVVETDVDARVEGAAGPGHLFVLAPVVLGEEDGRVVAALLPPFERQGILVATNSYRVTSGFGAYHYLPFVGGLVVVGSDRPWNATVTFRLGPAEPARVTQALPLSFFVGAERAYGLPDGPAGSLNLEASVPAGWTHQQVVNAPIEPDQVRDYAFVLPDGQAVQGTATMTGYWVPGLVGSASSNTVDAYGSFRQPAGNARMALTYVHADLSVDLALAVLAEFPAPEAWTEVAYRGHAWPFVDFVGEPPGRGPSMGAGAGTLGAAR